MKKTILTLATCLALVSCANTGSLDNWMQQQKQQAQSATQEFPTVTKPDIKPYELKKWDGKNAFDLTKLEDVQEQGAQGTPEPEESAPDDSAENKEFLQTIGLEDMVYSGMIDKRPRNARCTGGSLITCSGDDFHACIDKGSCYAFVNVKDSVGQQKYYRVNIGDKIGRDFGVVLMINLNSVLIREQIQDERGRWKSSLAVMKKGDPGKLGDVAGTFSQSDFERLRSKFGLPDETLSGAASSASPALAAAPGLPAAPAAPSMPAPGLAPVSPAAPAAPAAAPAAQGSGPEGAPSAEAGKTPPIAEGATPIGPASPAAPASGPEAAPGLSDGAQTAPETPKAGEAAQPQPQQAGAEAKGGASHGNEFGGDSGDAPLGF